MSVVDIKELIESVESRITASEGVNVLIEMQLGKLARKPCYQKLANRYPDSFIERDNHEVIKSELRLFNMIILEYLLECSYQEGATTDEIVDTLYSAIQFVQNPWEFTEPQIKALALDLLRNVLQNEGRLYRQVSKPLTNPHQADVGIDLVTKESRRRDGKSVTCYKLKDQAFQYLYRKKEIESYLYADLNFTAMTFYEAVKKGNFDVALLSVRELETVLINFTYRKIPEFILRMNQEFMTIKEEKRLLSDEAHENLQLALQKVREIRDLIGDKRRLISVMGMNGEVSIANEKYLANREKIKTLQLRINDLLKCFSDAFTKLQELNREYEYLVDHFEVKTSYEYLDYKQDLFPLLVGHGLEEQSALLRGLLSVFELPEAEQVYTLERLISSKRVRRSRVKEETDLMEDEFDPEFERQQAEEEQLKKEREAREVDLMLSILLFAIQNPEKTLKDYLDDLMRKDLNQYLTLLAAEEDDLFYRTVLYSLYNKVIYVPKNNSEVEMEQAKEMPVALRERLMVDERFDDLKGLKIETHLLTDEFGETVMIFEGFANFKFHVILPD